MKNDNLAQIRDAAIMQSMQPYLKHEVDAMQKAVVNRVGVDIAQGTLTPEKALLYWLEYNSFGKLLGRFDKSIRVGQAVAASNLELLDKGVVDTYPKYT